MSNILNSISEKSQQNETNKFKLSNHFQFGNQAGLADGTMNKTSNNKLNQSLRISYADMSETLKTYKSIHEDSIEKINKNYMDDYFHEWFKLMK